MANKLPSGNLNSRFFLGFYTAARPDWSMYLLEPRPHGSLKDPAKIQADIADKRAKQESAAPTLPVAGTVLAAAILDINGQVIAQFSQGAGEAPGHASVKLLETLNELLKGPDGNPYPLTTLDPYHDVQTRVFGLFIRERMRLVVLDALRYQVLTQAKVKVPLGLWYHRPFTYGCLLDPVDAIAPTDMRGDVDFSSICDFLGIPVPPPDAWVDPAVQANLAREIAIKAQLFQMT
jgi:hypothetical protein